MLKGLGTKLVLAQVMVAALLLGTAWLAQDGASTAQARILRIYDHQIFPLHRLSELTDSFAIDFVDTVHKVSDGSLSAAEGAARLERVSNDERLGWRQAQASMTTPSERQVLRELHQVLLEAERALGDAQSIMRAGDIGALARWRQRDLYVRVDPLTLRLKRQINAALDGAHADLFSLRADLSRAALLGTVSLSAVGLFAVVAGLFVASRFVASLRRVERVVEAAAAGDLALRIRLPGSDELSVMASRIDSMIEAIEKSQGELSRQAVALGRSEAEARAASTAKSAFLGTVSHELRTPLNVILGYTQALDRDSSLSADVRHGLSRIAEAGGHLLQLIDDVIGVARLDQAAPAVRLTAFAPAELLNGVSLMLAERARAKGLRFDVSSVGRVPAAVIGDRRRLLQVLLNLAGNAIKFTSKGGVSLEMGWDDERLWFKVRDSGPGISAEEQAELFQTFSQGAQGRKSGEGTGLGLHISREIARALGGDITLESTLGSGSTFRCEVDAPEGLAEQEQVAPPRALRAPAGHGLAPMLVVDDRPTNREVLCTLLRVTGFSAVEAADGEAALRYLESSRVSLVWLDLKMPGLDGSAVLAELRRREAEGGLARTPVVLISASVVDLSQAMVRAMGFDAWVPKPFRAEIVLETIQKLTSIQLVLDVPAETARASRAAPDPSKSFDIQSLSLADRVELTDLLTLGDFAAAADWARRLGPHGEPLVAQIMSFRTDALLDSLKLAGKGPTRTT